VPDSNPLQFTEQQIASFTFEDLDKNRKELSRWELAFKAEFEGIFSFLRALKAKDYNQAAIQLQRAESKFILYNVIPEFLKQSNYQFVATIHDSLVIEPEFKDLAIRIMKQQFKSIYGIKANIR